MTRQLLISTAFLILTACSTNKCENVDGWISEAPIAFDEFVLVKREILANHKIQEAYSIKGEIFLRVLDTTSYNSYEMPRLTEWFRKGRGYISFNSDDTSCCFKTCQSGLNTADGYIYYKKHSGNYKSSVQITDSLDLGNGWFALVVKCKGCNE